MVVEIANPALLARLPHSPCNLGRSKVFQFLLNRDRARSRRNSVAEGRAFAAAQRAECVPKLLRIWRFFVAHLRGIRESEPIGPPNKRKFSIPG